MDYPLAGLVGRDGVRTGMDRLRDLAWCELGWHVCMGRQGVGWSGLSDWHEPERTVCLGWTGSVRLNGEAREELSEGQDGLGKVCLLGMKEMGLGWIVIPPQI